MFVTQEFYENTFMGESVDGADFLHLCERAEEIVMEMTRYRLTLPVFNEMAEDMQTTVKKAICAQIEYLDANGGADADNGDGLASAGLGRFSYSKASGADGAQSIYSPRALRILAPTGLLYRGGGFY